jgi:hypothetical protein
MNGVKSFIRTTRELAETEIIKMGILNSGEFTLYNEKEEQLPKQKAQRRHEFNKAGNLYLCDVIKYICTHEAAFLDETAVYYSVRLSWSAFTKRAIGDNQSQYYRLCNEIMRTMEKHELCYIPKADGGYYLMQPFVVALESEDRSKLSSKELKNLANLSKGGKNPQEKGKVGYITILFAKPLFQKFLKDGGQFYQHPACIYAEVHKYLQQWSSKEEENAASDQMESAVVDAIDFFYIHGAGDPRHSKITVSLVDLLRSCYPTAVDHKGNKYYTRPSMASVFIQAIIAVTSNLDWLDYKITNIKEGKDGNIILSLTHLDRCKTVTD